MAIIKTQELFNKWADVENQVKDLNNKIDNLTENGALNTQLTGSITEEVRTYTDNSFYKTRRWLYFSNNDDLDGPTLVRPINVTQYSELAIHIQNNSTITMGNI